MSDEKIPETFGGMRIDPEVNFFGLTNYRNQNRKFGIKVDDRRRHMYLVGKTGMGKTTILENMVLNDIYAGHGVGLVDPHGDFAEKVIDFVPPHRINDIVYFNPADMDYPIGFNILESVDPEYRHLVASGLMGVFKKIWPDVWSARMEYILNNTILALLDYPGTTLLGINRLLADDDYREKVVAVLKDPVVKAFWESEFAKYEDRFRREAIAPIQNKIGQFLSASIIRNIVAQVKSRINIREIMDTQKIFIMNLSKGRIGEDNSRLLGGMLITKIQLSAMERVDIPEKDRKDFFLYVDEFQNFATESFANILSEARKYRLDLIMAHQYMEQLDEMVLAAVIGNVGTMVTFRVGSSDAEILAKEFIPTFVEEDLVNLPKYHIYLKLMIDGVASRPFSALTLPPIGSPTGSREKVVRVSRERYAVARDKIEDKISRWSSSEGGADELEDSDNDERDARDLAASLNPNAPIIVAEKVFIDSTTQNIAQPVVVPQNPNNSNNAPKVQSINPPKAPVAPRPQSGQSQQPRPQNNSKPPQQNKNRSGNGGGDQKSNNRNRGNNKNTQFNDIKTEKVLLVDTAQKGISLNDMLNSAPPPQQPPRPPAPLEKKIEDNSGQVPKTEVPKVEPPKELPKNSVQNQVQPQPIKQNPPQNPRPMNNVPKPPQGRQAEKPKPVVRNDQPRNNQNNNQQRNNGNNSGQNSQPTISLQQLKPPVSKPAQPQNVVTPPVSSEPKVQVVEKNPAPEVKKTIPPPPEMPQNNPDVGQNFGPKTLQPGQVIKLD